MHDCCYMLCILWRVFCPLVSGFVKHMCTVHSFNNNNVFFFFFPSNFYFKKIWFVNLFSHLPMLNFEFFLLIFFIDLLSVFVSFMLGYFFFLHLILFEYHLFIPLTSYWVFSNIFCSIIPLITNISYFIV